MISKIGQAESVYGVDLSLTGNITDQVIGISIGGIKGMKTRVYGLMVHSMMNETFDLKGLQVSSLNTSYRVDGVQIAVINDARRMRGLQTGVLFNVSRDLSGLQLGF